MKSQNSPYAIKKVSTYFLFFILSLAVSMTACKNDEDDNQNSSSEKASFYSVDDAAFSVLRALTNLSVYDENKVVNEDDNTVTGIETLPENWASLKFTCDQGYVLDETKKTVRSIAVKDLDEALEFFSSLISENITEELLTNGQYSWDYPGVGSLVFKKVTGNENLYATVDVKLAVMPDLTRLDFVSQSVVEKYVQSNNKYYGKSAFHAGDVIKRKKDDTYWLCVRPSGGPNFKDKSYWICLNPWELIKEETKKVKVYYNTGNNAYQQFSQDWVYAKNLMSLKTAKAAFHTLSSLVNEQAWTKSEYASPKNAYEALKAKGIDLKALHMRSDGENGPNSNTQGLERYYPSMFAFAYGSPKNDSNRSGVKLNKLASGVDKNVYKTAGQVNYIQPFVWGFCPKDSLDENLFTTVTFQDIKYSSSKNKKFLYSLTDSYDEVYLTLQGMWTHFSTATVTDLEKSQAGGDVNVAKGNKIYYNYANFLSNISTAGKLNFKEFTAVATVYPGNARYVPTLALTNWHVIISPELPIADNKGSATSIVRPVKEKDYEDVYVAGDNSDLYFDYWKSLTSGITRAIDGKVVDWSKEIKE